MSKLNDIDQYSAKETGQRLQKILQGAFAGPPTPLKDIPKRNGESRATSEPKKQSKKQPSTSRTKMRGNP
jgi:hypothetical protein